MNSVSSNPFCHKAYVWGIQDGNEGVERRAWEYFLPGGAAEDAYMLGYLIGMGRRQMPGVKRIGGGSEQPKAHRKHQEGRDLDQDLFDLRNGATQPIIRYTDEMMRQIEDERF